MGTWLDLVDQVEVVDSYSNDGTWEMLQERLSNHPSASFHQRPRGLYQSWNYGIAQLKTQFTYISTVGDSITRAGLAHLRDVAAEFNADVVISKPIFIEEEGAVCSHQTKWPIDSVTDELAISKPCVVDNWSLLLFLMENPVDAILGSSASNLYRTGTLQSRPFPTDYGTVGDGAWGLANLFRYSLGITPEKFSEFRRHEKAYSLESYAVADLNLRLFDLLMKSFEDISRNDADIRKRAAEMKCPELLDLVAQRMRWQCQLEQQRRRWVPWILNPKAWHVRRMRNQLRDAAKLARARALAFCSH
jgi:glycosyltransferase involved in cell wall biosynthesis